MPLRDIPHRGPIFRISMRKRILLSAAFGLVGLAAAIPIGDRLGIGAVESLIGCTLIGTVLGYALSAFLDVFLTNAHESE